MENVELICQLQFYAYVLVNTQNEYDKLMSYLEDLEIKWCSGELPTAFNCFKGASIIAYVRFDENKLWHAPGNNFPVKNLIDFKTFKEYMETRKHLLAKDERGDVKNGKNK